MKFIEKINAEWHRLIQNEGLTLKPCQDDADYYVVHNGLEVGRITEEGEVFNKPEHREVMDKVFEFFISAKEYVPAYCNAPEGQLPSGYRKISELGQYVFAAKQLSDYSYQFVTWQYSSYDHRSVAIGNYFSNYESAKIDFGVRIGMIDRSKLFSETELRILHNCLCRYLQTDNQITFEDERKANELREKIEYIIPDLNMDTSEEKDNDPELG
ncbi:MAG: hypothetical protein VB064_11615 [Oscillospiraceae bacterium]|nr:hypothetical protein [Oscillospiraceae bacterium]